MTKRKKEHEPNLMELALAYEEIKEARNVEKDKAKRAEYTGLMWAIAFEANQKLKEERH